MALYQVKISGLPPSMNLEGFKKEFMRGKCKIASYYFIGSHGFGACHGYITFFEEKDQLEFIQNFNSFVYYEKDRKFKIKAQSKAFDESKAMFIAKDCRKRSVHRKYKIRKNRKYVPNIFLTSSQYVDRGNNIGPTSVQNSTENDHSVNTSGSLIDIAGKTMYVSSTKCRPVKNTEQVRLSRGVEASNRLKERTEGRARANVNRLQEIFTETPLTGESLMELDINGNNNHLTQHYPGNNDLTLQSSIDTPEVQHSWPAQSGHAPLIQANQQNDNGFLYPVQNMLYPSINIFVPLSTFTRIEYLNNRNLLYWEQNHLPMQNNIIGQPLHYIPFQTPSVAYGQIGSLLGQNNARVTFPAQPRGDQLQYLNRLEQDATMSTGSTYFSQFQNFLLQGNRYQPN